MISYGHILHLMGSEFADKILKIQERRKISDFSETVKQIVDEAYNKEFVVHEMEAPIGGEGQQAGNCVNVNSREKMVQSEKKRMRDCGSDEKPPPASQCI